MKLFKKRFLTILLSLWLVLLLVACQNNKKADIITTLYPQYDIAKQIAGDKLSVKLMTPFGSEVHAYEPTAQDMIHIKNAKLFIFTSHQMERWVNNVIDTNTNTLDLSKSYESLYRDNTASDDLHYWTNPAIILQLIDVIKDHIIKIDQDNKSYYEENAQNYYQQIKAVHDELTLFLADKNKPSVFFYGHNAMASFGTEYGINIVSLSTNYKPDAELSSGQLITLKQKIKDANAKYLFLEELINLKAPNALVSELKNEGYTVNLLELHGFHNISIHQNKEGVRYVDLLKQNLENLKKALS